MFCAQGLLAIAAWLSLGAAASECLTDVDINLQIEASSDSKGEFVHRNLFVIRLSWANKQLLDVIIQMFEWTWDSIAAECTAFIGPAGMLKGRENSIYTLNYGLLEGYGFVQASPAQEHIQGQSSPMSFPDGVDFNILAFQAMNGGRITSPFLIS